MKDDELPVVEEKESIEKDSDIQDDDSTKDTEPNDFNQAEVEFSNDPEIDKVVDEIVNEESDELLEARDNTQKIESMPVAKKGFKAKIKSLFVAWWNNKRLRYGSIIIACATILISLLVPFSRYGLLNLLGVRVSSRMVITDSGTGLPLKNITVKLQGNEQVSDEEGKVSFQHLKQGASQLLIEKRGYAKYEKIITLGWGSNPIGEQQLVATGSRYEFILKDWLGEQIIKDATASSGEDVAIADEQGKITLTVSDSSDSAEIKIDANGYRSEELNINDLINDGMNEVKMVPAKKHLFVSNRDGKYDLYKIDVDGKNEELLLAATGKEREVPYVLVNPYKDIAAFISSRNGYTDKDKFALDELFTVDSLSGEIYSVTRSEQIQIIGWQDNRLIYVSVTEGVSAGNSQRSKITSFDIDSKQRTEIATANYFNDVKLINGKIYFAISSYAVPRSQAKLFVANTDGTNKKTLLDEQVWNIIRYDTNTIMINTESQQWYKFSLNSDENPSKTDAQPANYAGRNYIVSPDGSLSVWVEERDGKGTMLLHKNNDSSDEDVVVASVPGIGTPVYWADNDTIVFRVFTSQESADYVLSINANYPSRKIVDVSRNNYQYFY